MASDYDFTPDNGWTQSAYRKKMKNLATIINKLHDGQGPDLLGICEIENEKVIKDLLNEVGRDDLDLVQVDSEDLRGIDCGMIYSKNTLEVKDSKSHLIHTRYRTRDILQVKFKVLENNAELHAFMNHWPSRMIGISYTEPLRITAAEHCGRLVDKISPLV